MMTHTGGATVLSTRRLKKKLKKTTTKKPIPCHTQPPLYCATLCFFVKSVCKLCKTKKNFVRGSINTRNRDTCVFFFYVSMFGDTSSKRRPLL